jgi:hypothetical protein
MVEMEYLLTINKFRQALRRGVGLKVQSIAEHISAPKKFVKCKTEDMEIKEIKEATKIKTGTVIYVHERYLNQQ